MISDTNPYAPPEVSDTDTPGSLYWQVDGAGVIARNGATLPKVDLQTGVSGGEMAAHPLVLQEAGGFDVMRSLMVIGAYIALKTWFDPGPGAFLMLIVAVVVLRRIGALRGGSNSRILVWSFTEPLRAKRTKRRKRLRMSAIVLVFAGMMMSLFLTPGSGHFGFWVSRIFPAGMAVIIGMGIWDMLDRPKIKIKAASPGWLRIFPIHPDALGLLWKEQERLALLLPAEGDRKRLVRKTYLYRFPLRLLIGSNLRNPLLIIRLTLMKFLRSKLLVRESYHFSETEERPLDELAPQLRQAADAWLESQPGWQFITGEHLPSPTGDLTIESAVLASPDLAHLLRITRAWMEQAPASAYNQFTFATWLRNGTLVRTHDRPFLRLPQVGVIDHQASGNPDQIHQAHLRNLADQATDPAPDHATVRARLLHENQETDLLLTAGGYQDEAREIG